MRIIEPHRTSCSKYVHNIYIFINWHAYMKQVFILLFRVTPWYLKFLFLLILFKYELWRILCWITNQIGMNDLIIIQFYIFGFRTNSRCLWFLQTTVFMNVTMNIGVRGQVNLIWSFQTWIDCHCWIFYFLHITQSTANFGDWYWIHLGCWLSGAKLRGVHLLF